MKKYMLVSLVIAFLIVTVGSPCLGATVANTSKKGSLLIFPLIRTDFNPVTGEVYETLITIGNDYPMGVNLQCVFVLKDEGCEPISYDFDLTASQPLTFRASDGYSLEGIDIVGGGIGTGHVAELKCWAKKFVFDDPNPDAETTYQISFNHLSGEATLLRSVGGVGVGAATYNAWRFAANATLGDPVSIAGTLQLTGDANNYDACPATLIFDFLRQTPDPAATSYAASVDNYIALVPCKQDVSQGGGPTAIKTRLIRYDENERSGSGVICLSCFFADSASKGLNPPPNAPFAFPNVNTPAGMFRVEPFAEVGGPCNLPSPEVDTYPVVGVLVKQFNGFLGPMTASTPTGSGVWVPSPGAPDYRGLPAIIWDVY